MTSVSDNSCGIFATLGPTSSSNGENHIILLFTEHLISVYGLLTEINTSLEHTLIKLQHEMA